MTYIEVQKYARARGIIARINAAGTRVWFYTGEEDRKGTWLALGAVTLSGCNLAAHDVERLCRRTES